MLGGSEAGGMGASQAFPGSLFPAALWAQEGRDPLLYDNRRLMLDIQK